MLERFIFFAGIALLSTVNAQQMASAAPIATQTPIPGATGADSSVIQRAHNGAVVGFGCANVRFDGIGALGSFAVVCVDMHVPIDRRPGQGRISPAN
jgi:hypothetical protein